jgi:hypothetical protein
LLEEGLFVIIGELASGRRRKTKGEVEGMAFERFTASGRSFKGRVSIRRNGQISLSHGAVQKFNLADCPYVVLFYDKERTLMGLKPAQDPEEPGAYKLNHKGAGASIAGLAFLDYYGIDYSRAQRYDARWDEEHEMVVIDLSAPLSSRERSEP